MVDEEFYSDCRDMVKTKVGYAMFKIADKYYKSDITDVHVSNGDVVVDITFDPPMQGNVKITEVQLYKRDGRRWLSTPENITRRSNQEGVFYRFVFRFKDS